MKNTSIIILTIVLFFGCNQKEKEIQQRKIKSQVEQTNEKDTIVWIDTVSNDNFLKIYSNPTNDWQNLTAEFGNQKIKHKVDLQTEEYLILGIPFTNQIEWITQKSFALVNGCGTACKYALIFNTDYDKPIITPIEYYPGIIYADFKTDNSNVYIAVNENTGDKPSFIIVETDSQKKDTINLPNDWIRGVGSIYSIVDKIEIKDSEIEVIQKQENGRTKKLNKKIVLK